MKLYNSLSRTVEEFKPNDGKKVTLYTCGPTVYHFAHIGNLRSYIMEDILEKALRYLGYSVERAMNITDVGHLASDADSGEDKMLLGAKREHKSVLDIAHYYTEAFRGDMAKLALGWPKYVVPATSCIDDYIKIITTLMDKGYAYLAGGNVYFDTSKLKEYYRFDKQDMNNLMDGVRDSVEVDVNKRNKNDFVLWFTKSKFENQALKWDSPWGYGYPGWHIECSAISLKTLGEHLDIHCGGVDNKFPHHTNEIAQSESYLGHKWCNYWFHVEHLITASGKMSKSVGEFLTLSLLEEKGYSPMTYKFLCLQSHYRKQLLFSYEILDSAKEAYDKLVSRIKRLNKEDMSLVDQDGYASFKEKFQETLANDLNTSLAITVIFDVLKSSLNDRTKVALLEDFNKVLDLGLTDILNSSDSKEEDILPDNIKELVELRKKAKQDKDFKLADKIRDDLKELGFSVADTSLGMVVKKD